MQIFCQKEAFAPSWKSPLINLSETISSKPTSTTAILNRDCACLRYRPVNKVEVHGPQTLEEHRDIDLCHFGMFRRGFHQLCTEKRKLDLYFLRETKSTCILATNFYKNNSLQKVKKQMIYIAVLCNSRITAEPLYNTPLFIGPYAAANNTALLA